MIIAGAAVRGVVGRLGRLDVGLLRQREPARLRATSLDGLAHDLGRPVDIAVVRLDGLGDAMISMPLVLALTNSPAVNSVTLVCPPAVAAILGGRARFDSDPLLLNTLSAPTTRNQRLGRILSLTAVGQLAAYRAGRSRRGRWDLAILPRYDSDLGYNAVAFALGAGVLIAGHDPSLRAWGHERTEESDSDLLSIRATDSRSAVHELERARSLTRALGLGWPNQVHYGRPFFGLDVVSQSQPSSPDRTVVIATGATSARRLWPADRWRSMTMELLRRGDVQKAVFVGSAEDRPVQEEIVSGLDARARTVAGELPLASLPGLLSTAGLFIGTDSGPVHIASSLNVPAVVLSCHPRGADPNHYNSPVRFGPWSTTATSLQPAAAGRECVTGCVHQDAHCILGLRVEEVVEAARRSIAASS